MTLDTSPKAMWDELEASRRQVEAQTKHRTEMIRRYTGPYYDDAERPAGNEPENPAFEYLSTVSSLIMAGIPQCSIKATRADRPLTAMKARALQHSTNRVSRDRNDRSTFEKLFVDWCFGPAIAHQTRTPTRMYDSGPLDGPVYRPALRRVRPELWRRDARATDWEDTRWRGHGTLTSKKGLLALAQTEEGWRTDIIERLREESGLDSLLPKEGANLSGRDDVKLWTVWVAEEQIDPDFTPEEGYYGTIHYYAETERSRFNGGATNTNPLEEIRDPQPYFGCSKGPYHMGGQMYVPDRVQPLAVMVAIEQIARTMGMQSAVIDDAIRKFKRFLVEGSGQKNVGALLKNARHNGVVKIKGFQKGMAEAFTIGGIDNTMLAAYQFLQDMLDKRSGLSQTQRGNAQSGTTATAETYAAQGSSARIALLRDKWYGFAGEMFAGTAEMIDQDDQFWMPAPPELAAQMPEGIFGGREPGERFSDYELTINALSMRYRSEEERAAAAEYELALFQQIAPMAVQYPFLDIPSILIDVADARGESHLPARFNAEVAAGVAAVMLMGALNPATAYQPGMARTEPTMAKDLPANRQGAQAAMPQAQLAGPAKPAAPAVRQPGAAGARPGANPMSGARSTGAMQGNRARKSGRVPQGAA